MARLLLGERLKQRGFEREDLGGNTFGYVLSDPEGTGAAVVVTGDAGENPPKTDREPVEIGFYGAEDGSTPILLLRFPTGNALIAAIEDVEAQ